MGDPDLTTLAINGGEPARSGPLPSVGNAAGRRFGDEELAGLRRVMESGQLNSTVGGETKQLEREFGEYYGVEHVIASSSGTAALHLAVAAVNPEPGDEIITTPISDAGTILPILMQNAVPVFADLNPITGMLDIDSVRSKITDRTRAIIVVHLFGAPAPAAEFRALADEHGLVLIEDCAQAYLTRTAPDGALAGTVGHIGCFSLQQSKHITAGDGGFTITNDHALGRRARLFVDKAWPRDTDERTHLFLATNYRMTELQAAVARAQLPKLAGIVADRRARAARLTEAISGLDGITIPPGDGASFWLYPLIIDPAVAGAGNHEYGKALAAEGVPANPGYLTRPLYLTPLLTERRTYGESGYPLTAPPAREVPQYGPGLCPIAESLINDRLIVIGWNENYTDADIDAFAAGIRKVHGYFRARTGV